MNEKCHWRLDFVHLAQILGQMVWWVVGRVVGQIGVRFWFS